MGDWRLHLMGSWSLLCTTPQNTKHCRVGATRLPLDEISLWNRGRKWVDCPGTAIYHSPYVLKCYPLRLFRAAVKRSTQLAMYKLRMEQIQLVKRVGNKLGISGFQVKPLSHTATGSIDSSSQPLPEWTYFISSFVKASRVGR